MKQMPMVIGQPDGRATAVAVAKRSSTSSQVNGRDMSGHPQELLQQNSGTNCSPAQIKTLELPYTGLTVRSPWAPVSAVHCGPANGPISRKGKVH